MRLSADQIRAIRETAAEVFGRRADVRLIGSRVDDSKCGGDIDLYIKTESAPVEDLMRSEALFLAKLKARLGDQKIDLLLDYPTRHHRPEILDVARRHGVHL